MTGQVAGMVPFRALPVDQSDVRYAAGPDSERRPGVPAGTTVEFAWNDSAIYPGTTRKFWIHAPARHDPGEPAGPLVFQDGWRYLDPDGDVRAGIVLDNLVERGDIPPTVAVFVDPGVRERDEERPRHRICGGSSGGNPYPALLRDTPPRPLRVFLLAAHRDLNWNQPNRNWLANNLAVAAALAEAGYDFRLVLGDGGHNLNHTGVLLPDALRWACRT